MNDKFHLPGVILVTDSDPSKEVSRESYLLFKDSMLPDRPDSQDLIQWPLGMHSGEKSRWWLPVPCSAGLLVTPQGAAATNQQKDRLNEERKGAMEAGVTVWRYPGYKPTKRQVQ